MFFQKLVILPIMTTIEDSCGVYYAHSFFFKKKSGEKIIFRLSIAGEVYLWSVWSDKCLSG